MSLNTWAETLAQAVSVATVRAQRTSIRQRVEVCRCGRTDGPFGAHHFVVKAVDRIPAGALA